MTARTVTVGTTGRRAEEDMMTTTERSEFVERESDWFSLSFSRLSPVLYLFFKLRCGGPESLGSHREIGSVCGVEQRLLEELSNKERTSSLSEGKRE